MLVASSVLCCGGSWVLLMVDDVFFREKIDFVCSFVIKLKSYSTCTSLKPVQVEYEKSQFFLPRVSFENKFSLKNRIVFTYCIENLILIPPLSYVGAYADPFAMSAHMPTHSTFSVFRQFLHILKFKFFFKHISEIFMIKYIEIIYFK